MHWRHRRANRQLARARVPVESVLASVKLRARWRPVADVAMLVG